MPTDQRRRKGRRTPRPMRTRTETRQANRQASPRGPGRSAPCESAELLQDLPQQLGLVPFVKTSGSKGLHVHVPLDRRAPFDEVRAFSRRMAALVASRDPTRLTTEHRKAKRRGRVFIDVLRNGYGQTAVPPFAVRALPGAPVAVPVGWDEVSRPGLGPRSFRMADLGRRLSGGSDPWNGFRRRGRSLRAPARRLDAMGD